MYIKKNWLCILGLTLLFPLIPSLSLALPEAGLAETFETLAKPYFEEGHAYIMNTHDNVQIHYRVFPASQNPAKGNLLIVSGRNEFMRKYAELIYDLKDSGYTIYIYDHRGQGESARLLADPLKGHVGRFQDYVNDFNQFIYEVVRPQPNDKLYVLAHSMGAAAVTRFATLSPGVITAFVASSPMYKINTGDFLRPVSFALLDTLISMGQGDNYVPGLGPKGWFKSFQQKYFTTSMSRKAYADRELSLRPELAVEGPTNRWVYEAILNSYLLESWAHRFETPTLILRAENEFVVDPKAEEDFCRRAKSCQISFMPGSKHEVLMEQDFIRDRALTEALEFFEQY